MADEADRKRKPPLHRGQACAACKRKKRKCDAKKPVCTPCQTSSALYQEDPVCEWPTALTLPGEVVASTSQPEVNTDSPPVADRPNKLRKQKVQSEGDSPAVETLLARIAELEQALVTANSQGANKLVPKLEASISTPPLTSGPSAPPSSLGSPHPPSNQQGEPADARKILNQPTSALPSPSTPNSLFWTAWPFDLPHLRVVRPLCEVALSMIQTSYILSPDSFFHALALPPTDPRFPSPALLHAMCTLGSMMSPLPATSNEYWRSAPSPSVYHFRCAKSALADHKMHNILDNCRASLLLTMYSFAVEQFVDVWQLVGNSARSLAPAGLNHVQNNCALPSTKISVTPGHFLRKPPLAPSAVDDYDVFYRTTTMWQIFMIDVWMSACSGWSAALSLEDITSLLPVWPSDASPLDIVLNQVSLDPHSPLFFTNHLQSPILSLHLAIKSMVLLSQVSAFLQRATLPSHIISSEIKHRIRESQAFVQCCEKVLAFQRAFPITVANPISQLPDGRLDANLINAHVVPFVALLLLHEPFIFNQEDVAFKLSVSSANSIYRIASAIYSHSQDQIVYYFTPINYCYMVAARTLIRAMRFKEDEGDAAGAADFRLRVEFLLARITPLSSKSPLVASCLGMLEMLIRDSSPWHRG